MVTKLEAEMRSEIQARIDVLSAELRWAPTPDPSNFDTYNDFLDEEFVNTRGEVEHEIALLRELLKQGTVLYQSKGTLTAKQDPILAVDFEAISQEFIEYLSRHPHLLETMHWRKFEELLLAIFQNQGYRAILGTGSGDQGVDLTLFQRDSIGEVMTLVQAKRYSRNRPIELEAVAALYGTVERFQANRGLFVTTSKYLPSAKKLAEERTSRIVLADSEDIIRWCRQLCRER